MTRSWPGRGSSGAIDELPSGALRVRVYAGEDPISGRRHDLVEVISPGPKATAVLPVSFLSSACLRMLPSRTLAAELRAVGVR